MAVALLCFGSSAWADGTIVNVELTGVNGAYQVWGYYAGPYTLAISPNSNYIPSTSMLGVCDDFTTDIYQGYKWTAYQIVLQNGNLTNLDEAKFYGTTGLSGASGQTLYEQAAFLVHSEFKACGAGGNVGTCDNISAALWALMDPAIAAKLDQGQQAWITAAEAAAAKYGTAEFDGLDILTPTCSGSTVPCGSQEFWIYTPEASTSALLGVGLVALVALI